MNFRQDPLWHRISAYSFDDPEAAVPFSQKLASEQRWTAEFTQKAITEYRRFIYLCCISPTGASPSPIVDEVWHLHLTYTVDYWQYFCKETLGKDVDHQPSKGGEEQQELHARWYRQTLNLYRETFGTAPPVGIWLPEPPPIEVADSGTTKAVSFFELGSDFRFFLLVLPFVYCWVANPFAIGGPQFLLLYSLLALTSFVILGYSFWAKKLLLRQVLKKLIPVKPSPFELAYLAGAQARMVLLLMVELINHDILIPGSDDKYKIDLEANAEYHSPITKYLAAFPASEISFNDCYDLGLEAAFPIHKKYRPLKTSFDRPANNYILPLLMVVFGLVRVGQGIANGQPTGLLVLTIVLYVAVFRLLLRVFNFHYLSRMIVKDKDSEYLTDKQEFARKVIVDGAEALYGRDGFSDLRKSFNTRTWRASRLRADYDFGIIDIGGGGGCGGCVSD